MNISYNYIILLIRKFNLILCNKLLEVELFVGALHYASHENLTADSVEVVNIGITHNTLILRAIYATGVVAASLKHIDYG